MKLTKVLIINLYSISVIAQVDFNNSKVIPVPPTTKNQTELLSIPPSNTNFDLLGGKKLNFNLDEKPKSIGFGEKSTFANPNKKLQNKLNEKEGAYDLSLYRRDQYLGDISTDSKKVTILCRDYESVDGDRIRILINDKTIVSDMELYATYSSVTFSLNKGFNKIDFKALNMGLYPPNTAELIIYNDSGQVIASHKWMITTGHKATFIVVKK